MSAQDPRPNEATTSVPDGETARSAPPAFVAELSERVQQTRATIDSATAAGEDELAAAHLGELEGLVDLAAAHDVALPDTVAYLAEQQSTEQSGGRPVEQRVPGQAPRVVDLTATAPLAGCTPA
ncbi:hypothetical protein [Kineococcus sp. SYSU DK018]|uniref:hypothetical protein n=1 Tax=Kineococcus sp. SYSU DK018 TaxID=3383139 RepID=UPI003D7DD4BA